MGLGVAAEHRRLRRRAPSLLVAFVAGGAARGRAGPAAVGASAAGRWSRGNLAARGRRRASLIGLSSYVPTYVQGVLGTGALVAGFALAALTVGWPIAATLSGRLYLRIGFRDTALIGGGVVVVGAVLCALLGRRAPVWQVGGACFVVGVGLGFVSSADAGRGAVGRRLGAARRRHRRPTCSAAPSAARSARRSSAPIANATLASHLAHPPAAVAAVAARRRRRRAWCCRARQPRPTARPPTSSGRALYAAAHHVFVGARGRGRCSRVAALLLMPRRTEPLTFD